uniref:RGS domain-containing protein n=1 Tax=Faxonius propinquus nudivirus TaxID=3139431 RepID=A0AAU8GE37_9VIRU
MALIKTKKLETIWKELNMQIYCEDQTSIQENKFWIYPWIIFRRIPYDDKLKYLKTSKNDKNLPTLKEVIENDEINNNIIIYVNDNRKWNKKYINGKVIKNLQYLKTNSYKEQVLFITKQPSYEDIEIITDFFKGSKIIFTINNMKFNLFKLEDMFEKLFTNKEGTFFIRRFIDKIGTENDYEWFWKELTTIEKAEYVILSSTERKNCEVYEMGKTIKNLSVIYETDMQKAAWNQIRYHIKISKDMKNAPIDKKFNFLLFTRWHFGYHIPLYSEIKACVKFIGNDKVLSIFSGLGYIELLLQLEGVKIIATDNFSENIKPFIKTLNIDADKVVQYCPTNILLLSWPPINDIAFNAIKKFKGNKIIYFGTEREGCCASRNFFNYLEDNFFLIKTEIINDLQTNYLNDYSSLHCYIRNIK